MKKQSKWIALAAMLAIAAAAVTGCGAETEPAASAPTSTGNAISADESAAPDAMDVRIILKPDCTGTIDRNGSVTAVEYVLEERTPIACIFTVIDGTGSAPNTPTEVIMQYDKAKNTLTCPNGPESNANADFTFTKALAEPDAGNDSLSAAE